MPFLLLLLLLLLLLMLLLFALWQVFVALILFLSLFLLQLRKAQDEIGELQTVNDHLQKRFDKLKSKRKDDT